MRHHSEFHRRQRAFDKLKGTGNIIDIPGTCGGASEKRNNLNIDVSGIIHLGDEIMQGLPSLLRAGFCRSRHRIHATGDIRTITRLVVCGAPVSRIMRNVGTDRMIVCDINGQCALRCFPVMSVRVY